jgi:hypothetical protein
LLLEIIWGQVKKTKAEDLGVAIISEQDFIDMIS